MFEESARAGVHVFARGVHKGVEPVRIGAGVTASPTRCGQPRDRGLHVLVLPPRADAVERPWTVSACPGDQELRNFMYDQTN